MKEEDSYKYTADRLREIGKGLNAELMVIYLFYFFKNRKLKLRFKEKSYKKS